MSDFLQKWKRYFVFAALLSCFVNILQLTFPFYMFAIYRNIVISYSGYSLGNITIAAFMAVIAMGFFSYVRSRLLAVAGHDLVRLLHRKVYGGMVRGAALDSNRAYKGGINDLEVLRNYFSSAAIYALFDAPWAPFYLLIIFMIHPTLGFIASSGAAIMVGLSVLQEMLIRNSMKDANIAHGRNQRFVDSFLRNAEVINGMGMLDAIGNRFAAGNSQVIANQTRSSYQAGTIQAIIKPMQNVIQVLIYCVGAWYGITQGFNIGLMVAASIIMGRALAPLMQFMGAWRLTGQAREAFTRLKKFSERDEARTQPMAMPAPRGHLAVDGAVFRAGEHVLLKGVRFTLDQGEFLGLIGPSGAGKTTLCRLLLGIWPSLAGKVYLDGRDIFTWNKEEVGRFIGYLPQEIELFPGTVAHNIARLGPADGHKLAQAIELSGIGDLLESLPQGLDTELGGPDAVRLSGGQKQKIGLARALYHTPRFLVLDEPTSNLDEQGERRLLFALAQLKQRRCCTCIMVTHKISLLQSMDKILVLRQGAVAMFGAKDSVFAELAKSKAPAGTASPTTQLQETPS